VRIRILLGAGLGLIAVAVAVTLSRAPQTLARTNGVPLVTKLAVTTGDARGCQRGERLPRGTSAIRLGLFSILGPKVTVQVFAGSRVVTEGTRGPGWEGTYLAVAVGKRARSFAPVTVCFRLAEVDSEVSYLGSHAPRSLAMTARGKTLPGRMTIEYLRPGKKSWWSFTGSIVRDMGFGHAVVGVSVAVLALTLTGAALALSSWLVVRELR
jgi:hypothetical protein